MSFTTRQPLEGLCGYGYQVVTGKLNFHFGSDLIHRLLHIPSIGEGVAEHYADTYSECLELAVSDPALAVRNSHTLQYFALDVYAYDIALPGEGCTGREPESSAESSITPTATATETTPSATGDAPAVCYCRFCFPTDHIESATHTCYQECHTHADGTEHCS